MDPNQALKDLLDVLARKAGHKGELAMDDRREVMDSLEALHGWLARGGFAPKVTETWAGPERDYLAYIVG